MRRIARQGGGDPHAFGEIDAYWSTLPWQTLLETMERHGMRCWSDSSEFVAGCLARVCGETPATLMAFLHNSDGKGSRNPSVRLNGAMPSLAVRVIAYYRASLGGSHLPLMISCTRETNAVRRWLESTGALMLEVVALQKQQTAVAV